LQFFSAEDVFVFFRTKLRKQFRQKGRGKKGGKWGKGEKCGVRFRTCHSQTRRPLPSGLCRAASALGQDGGGVQGKKRKGKKKGGGKERLGG